IFAPLVEELDRLRERAGGFIHLRAPSGGIRQVWRAGLFIFAPLVEELDRFGGRVYSSSRP
ncbi:hypothetical protein, partial [Limnospira platensis]|uniref:hypothetical protein n=1 Tax=Limnospira platensis TaxID=118562 RepID=UPI00396CEDDE